MKLEADQKESTQLGFQSQALQFAKQIKDLSDQLDQNVNTAIQDAMNGLSAADIAGKIDTPEEVWALRGTLFQNLDKQIAGQIVGNAADRKLIIDQYNQTIATSEAFVKNKSIINEPMSKAMGYYVDGNGNKMQTPN